jgi:citrate lyase beta subunit
MNPAVDMSHPIPGEKPMPKFIRRSLFALAADDPALADEAAASWADAIVLDLVHRPGVDSQADLRARMPAAIHAAGKAGSEVFVRVAAQSLQADLDAAVFRGLTGVIVTGVRDASEVTSIAQRLAVLEGERGVPVGSLEIDIQVDNAAAVWNALEIARASERFGLFIVDEAALCRDLGMQTTPELDFDPLEYIKSQLITMALSVGGQAVGLSYPHGLAGAADEAEIRKAVRRARDTGFKGALCPSVAWVKACNEGFRPTAEEAGYYVKVIEVFAEGLKRGMASVPIDGKMIDVPVDVRAKLYLKWAQRAQARDDEKAGARR